jgi:hypothetical protein
MAVAPPFDLIIEKIPTAISKIERVFQKIQTKITDVALDISKESVQLPNRISCSDPRVVRLKNLLTKLSFYIQELLKYLSWLNIATAILSVVASAGAAYVAFRLAIPQPLIAVDSETINFQKELFATIKSVIKKFAPILALITASVATSSVIIAPAINIISQICVNEELPINAYTQAAIAQIQQTAVEVEGVAISESRFYQDVNVSEDDIQSRADALQALIDQQRSLTDLLEAPSTVILVVGRPDNSIGKAGDYAINRRAKIIYGPKPSDSEWNEGINY